MLRLTSSLYCVTLLKAMGTHCIGDGLSTNSCWIFLNISWLPDLRSVYLNVMSMISGKALLAASVKWLSVQDSLTFLLLTTHWHLRCQRSLQFRYHSVLYPLEWCMLGEPEAMQSCVDIQLLFNMFSSNCSACGLVDIGACTPQGLW